MKNEALRSKKARRVRADGTIGGMNLCHIPHRPTSAVEVVVVVVVAKMGFME